MLHYCTLSNLPFYGLFIPQKTKKSVKWSHYATVLLALMTFMVLPFSGLHANGNEAGNGPEGLFAHYDFNKSWNDMAGQYHAEAHRMWRGRDVFTFARRGSALFQAKGNHLLLPVNTNADSMPQMSFTAWIKPDAVLKDEVKTMTIFSNMRQGKGQAFRILYDSKDGKASLLTMLGNNQSEPFPVNIDGWTFVALTYNHSARRITLYANNQKRTITGVPESGMGILYLGYCLNYPTLLFEGLMDDVRIYNTLLGDAEIYSIRDARVPANELFAENTKVFAARKSAVQAKPNWALEGETLATVSRADALKPTRVLGIKNDRKSYDELSVPKYFIDGRRAPGAGLFGGGRYAQRVVEFEVDAGRFAYVDMKDVVFYQAGHPFFLKYWRMFINYTNFLNFIITVVGLLLLLYGILYYSVLDKVIVDWSRSFADPGVAWPALVFMVTGIITGFIARFSEPIVYQFATSPILWPAGHAAGIWILWSLMVIMGLTVVVSLVESMVRANWWLGLPRFLLLMVLSSITFLTYSFAVAQSFWIGVIILIILVRLPNEFSKVEDKTGIKGQWVYVDG